VTAPIRATYLVIRLFILPIHVVRILLFGHIKSIVVCTQPLLVFRCTSINDASKLSWRSGIDHVIILLVIDPLIIGIRVEAWEICINLRVKSRQGDM
jgi:hypothetical protein